MPDPFNVLFLCTGNSARSIMAESLLTDLGQGRFRAFSAGSFPKGLVRPEALALLREHGLPLEGLRSKPWDEYAAHDAPVMDFVFTLCDEAADEPCPVWPGQPVTANWGVPDPAATQGSDAMVMLAYRDAFRMIERRLRMFTALPLRSLGSVAIQRGLEEIGRVRADTFEGAAS